MSVVEQGSASMADAEIGIPEFPVALRGYERQQVDIFVKDLSIRVTAERRRAEQAERAGAQMRAELATLRNQPPPSFEHLGSEAARVLEQAGASAKLLVEEARSRGQSLVEEAEVQARELIGRAEQRAAELEADAGETLAEAARERERILSEAAAAVEDARARAEAETRAAMAHATETAERTLADATETAERTREQAMREQASMQSQTTRLRESRDQMLEYLGRIHSDLGELLAEAVQAEVELPAAEEVAGPTASASSQAMVDESHEGAGDAPGAGADEAAEGSDGSANHTARRSG
jgi:cell division septum initiation protein DivIVA